MVIGYSTGTFLCSGITFVHFLSSSPSYFFRVSSSEQDMVHRDGFIWHVVKMVIVGDRNARKPLAVQPLDRTSCKYDAAVVQDLGPGPLGKRK